MANSSNCIILLILLPLFGAVLNGLFGKKFSHTIVHSIAIATPALSFLMTLFFLNQYLLHGQNFSQTVFDWIVIGDLDLQFSLLLDPLSLLMSLIITGVGSLIHLYSIGYMHRDPGYSRYFSYLNLFIASMMILVLGKNLLVTFVGWEGVGLCSYLLIGFWFEDKHNTAAGKKAFIVNRIGDFGFLIGIMLIFSMMGTLEYQRINEAAVSGGYSTIFLNLAALALFIGAIGKSAQIPLYVWLPDAMAGPTPVSALIHAATMVTAGVFMIGRLNGLFIAAPLALHVIAVIGAVTAIFAATNALVQNDIKKVLAYSTVSQLGFMFTAMGVGAFSIGIFHLMTHAFFKACLFLGAGSVIHAMAGEQDMRKMGGVAKYMPTTFLTFLLATMAISGYPLFSGFFSKDEIIWNALASEYGHIGLWLTMVLASLCTTFYMFRIIFMTFLGDSRANAETKAKLHESPKTITFPLIVLGVLSLLGGLIGIPHVLGKLVGHIPNLFGDFLSPVFKYSAISYKYHSTGLELGLMAVNIVIAAGGTRLAYMFYRKGATAPTVLSLKLKGLHQLLLAKYHVDEVYDKMIIKPLLRASDVILFKVVDRWVIDFFINFTAKAVQFFALVGQKFQTGQVQSYVMFIWIGLICLIFFYIKDVV